MQMRLVLVFAVILVACNTPDADQQRHDSIEAVKDSLRAYTDSVLNKDKYCFQKREDALQFLPDSIGAYERTYDELSQIMGMKAENTRMYAEYDNGYGHIIKVRILEYCAAPEMIAVDYSLRYEMRKSTAEFNEFDVPPTHHGFCTFSTNEGAYLLVEADSRFLVEIEDNGADNTKEVLAFYEAIPLEKLAAFGK